MEDKKIEKIENLVINKMGKDSSGHDFYHALRVKANAIKIYKKEKKGNEKIIIAASLLHDIPDTKLCNDIDKAIDECKEILKENSFNDEEIEHVIYIIKHLGFKGGCEKEGMKSIEGKIVQDADRLDAIGAIGVARCFAFGGSHDRLLWDPSEKAKNEFKNEEEYRGVKSSSLTHFEEKLFKLKNLMQTETGKEVAIKRHQYLIDFKKKFIEEWNGEDII